MAEEVFALLRNGWTPGGVGIWVLVLMTGVGLWKGLPAMLDAWTRRADAEAIRIDNEFKRLERHIEAGERRHSECEERCKALQDTVAGLSRQMRQMQLSAVRLGADEPPTITATLIAELDRLPSGDFRT